MKTMIIRGVSRTLDCQDGSYSITVYNDVEEMLAAFRKYNKVEDVSDEEFLNEDDPYENGYLDFNVIIEIDVETGRLVKPFRLNVG